MGFCPAHGIMEWSFDLEALDRWNIGMLIVRRKCFFFSIIEFNIRKNSTIKPNSHFPRTHYSIIPVFQLSNWGEAPKFGLHGVIRLSLSASGATFSPCANDSGT